MDGLYRKTLLKCISWGYHHFRKHPCEGKLPPEFRSCQAIHIFAFNWANFSPNWPDHWVCQLVFNSRNFHQNPIDGSVFAISSRFWLVVYSPFIYLFFILRSKPGGFGRTINNPGLKPMMVQKNWALRISGSFFVVSNAALAALLVWWWNLQNSC